jgi:hypothetical protein
MTDGGRVPQARSLIYDRNPLPTRGFFLIPDPLDSAT